MRDLVHGCTAVIIAALAAACSSPIPAHAAPIATAPVADASVNAHDAPAPALTLDAAVPACPAGVPLVNGACRTDADCALTDAPTACDACNVARAYPTPRATLAERTTRCAPTPACNTGCPPRDTDTPAFYRAECRAHRCLAWRYHGGG